MSVEDTNRFTEKDVMDALQAYYDKDLVRYPIGSISYNSGIHIERNKRNFRKQRIHLKIARSTLDIMNEESGKSLQGRKQKKDVVQSWRLEHPSGSKAECIRDTGLSKPTVYKWW